MGGWGTSTDGGGVRSPLGDFRDVLAQPCDSPDYFGLGLDPGTFGQQCSLTTRHFCRLHLAFNT